MLLSAVTANGGHTVNCVSATPLQAPDTCSYLAALVTASDAFFGADAAQFAPLAPSANFIKFVNERLLNSDDGVLETEQYKQVQLDLGAVMQLSALAMDTAVKAAMGKCSWSVGPSVRRPVEVHPPPQH